MDPEFCELSAQSLVAGLQSKAWTSVQLTQYFLNRIRKIDPGIHSVPFLFPASALAQAEESDARRAAGKSLSSLDGLPMTIKDAIRMRGSRCTYGMSLFRNHHPKTDSRLIEVLRQSGIVFLGRTAVPTGAFDWNCRNWVYSECVNPFDAARTPGGSSGGAAAALAKGLTPLELGSDLGGSIRYPAHCCGIYGLKTTDGWLPVEDVGPEKFRTAFRQMVTFGPMARNLEDLDLLLQRFAAAFPRPEMSRTFPSGSLAIAFSREISGMSPEPSMKKLFDAFLDRLSAGGHVLVERKPDFDMNELYLVWGIISGYEFAQAVPRIVRYTPLLRVHSWWSLDHRLGKGPITSYFKKGLFASKAEYLKACTRRKEIFEGADRFFEEHPLWILPVAPSSAIPRSLCGKRIATPNGLIEYSRYVGSYTVPLAAMGTPILAYPIGFDEEGMPLGVQILGARYSDRWLVETARLFKAPGSGASR